MKFVRLYRASLYISLFLASLLLNVDASGDNRFALLYPLAIAVASALAFFTVDLDPKRGIPRDLANFLALLAFCLGFVEFLSDTNLLLMAIGHTLIYLQIIKYALPKTVEDDWYLLLLGLVQVVIGVHVSQSDEVGILLLLWTLATIWTMGLFYLQRETIGGDPPVGVKISPRVRREDPYPGLFDYGFVLATLRVAGTTLALGALIFIVMPRWSTRGGIRNGKVTPAKHLTGFSDSVTLGDIGYILDNDSIVLSLELTDENDQTIVTPPDLLLRGVTLTGYGNKVWTRESTVPINLDHLQKRRRPNRAEIRQRIKMEATDGDILFALNPILQVKGPMAGAIRMNEVDGTLFHADRRENTNDPNLARATKFDYQVVSSANSLDPQVEEKYPDETRIVQLLSIPEPLEERLQAIVAPILAKLPEDQRDSPASRVRALERYLRDGDFTYSLNMTQVDRRIDPVIDFLENRKEGHCEYFASALALLSRASGVPARLVNGFKGGDWNQIGQITHVRQKHAHSWVEALVGISPSGLPIWLTLDPTPGRQREESVARVGAGSFRFRLLSDSIRSIWTFSIVGFDSDRQERKIYGPIRQFATSLATAAARGFGILFRMVRDLPSWLYFKDFRHFFSVRGFFVSTLAMLALAVLISVGRGLWRRIWKHVQRGKGADESRDPSLAFYHRLVKIFASVDLVRAFAETPREFGIRAKNMVVTQRPGSDLADVPGLVVDAFYSRRFGRNEISPELIAQLENRLEALEAALMPITS